MIIDPETPGIKPIKLVARRKSAEQGKIPGWMIQGIVAGVLFFGAFAWWVFITPL